MGEEIAIENAPISNFLGLVTLTLDRVTAYRHASLVDLYLHTNVIEIEETFVDRRTDGHFRHVIRSTRRSLPRNGNDCKYVRQSKSKVMNVQHQLFCQYVVSWEYVKLNKTAIMYVLRRSLSIPCLMLGRAIGMIPSRNPKGADLLLGTKTPFLYNVDISVVSYSKNPVNSVNHFGTFYPRNPQMSKV